MYIISRPALNGPPKWQSLGDRGWFAGVRTILIDGEVLDMPQAGPTHSAAAGLAEYALAAAFGAGHRVRVEKSLDLGGTTDPVPDVAVVPGSPRQSKQHPTTALLVVEVADSSLDYDRTEKASLYAAAGVTDYWVLDVAGACLEVSRGPAADPTARLGSRSAAVTRHAAGDAVAPLARPQAAVAVADLLP